MTDKRKMYIAIGTYKTGTTAIQDFLNLNRKKLSEEGLDVFTIVRECQTWGEIQKQLRVKYHFKEETKLYSYIDFDSSYWKNSLENNTNLLIQDIQKYVNSRKNSIFLAFQGLYDFHPKRFGYKSEILKEVIKPYLNEFDINILINYRHQDSFIEGVYNTWNQPYFEANFDEYIKIYCPFSDSVDENAQIDWLDVTKYLKQNFPEANLIVNSYEIISKEGLFKNLCDTLNLDIKNYKIPEKDVNPGLNNIGIHIMKSASFLNREDKKLFHSIMMKNETIKKKPGEKYNFISNSEKKKIYSYYHSSNRELFNLSDNEMQFYFKKFDDNNEMDDKIQYSQECNESEKVLISNIIVQEKNSIRYNLKTLLFNILGEDIISKLFRIKKRLM